MRTALHISIMFFLVTFSNSAVITGACEWDLHSGAGTCCAIRRWLCAIWMCTLLGQESEECHPASRKVPFSGQRQHHTCPCAPNLQFSRCLDGKFHCSASLKSISI
ncbi:prokineticin-1-like [Tamandua tetradactyla]|uniref:prokineticin-1-like n=1 Tax=Tamandua tetradactyla TaxID=48850 RepID=UPI004053FC36